MSKIHFLQVKHGDSFIIECEKGGNKGVVVVDGGPTGCGYVLQNKLNETGLPDLLVLSHYDDDHIGGILQYINSCRDNSTLPAKEIWANCAGCVKVESDKKTSAKQGAKLSILLDEMAKSSQMIWHDDMGEGYERDLKYGTIEVLSPLKSVMLMAVKKQEDEARKFLKASPQNNEDLRKPLDELVNHVPDEPNLENDDELANAASIAFVLRCDGLSVLMLGDSYPQNVEDYLRKVKGYSEDKPLEVDYVKVSHHGSRNNTSNTLLDIIKCNKYLISTNGGLNNSNHPDRTAIAHILCHPMRDMSEKVHLFFNYGLNLIERVGAKFLNDGESQTWNFEIHENVTTL